MCQYKRSLIQRVQSRRIPPAFPWIRQPGFCYQQQFTKTYLGIYIYSMIGHCLCLFKKITSVPFGNLLTPPVIVTVHRSVFSFPFISYLVSFDSLNLKHLACTLSNGCNILIFKYTARMLAFPRSLTYTLRLADIPSLCFCLPALTMPLSFATNCLLNSRIFGIFRKQ